MNTPIYIGIYHYDKLIKQVSTSFLAPMKKQHKEETEEDED
jgi:hypothetical protein